MHTVLSRYLHVAVVNLFSRTLWPPFCCPFTLQATHKNLRATPLFERSDT
jgi:hypothetical protein